MKKTNWKDWTKINRQISSTIIVKVFLLSIKLPSTMQFFSLQNIKWSNGFSNDT